MGYNFEIQHKQWKQNLAGDALSRSPVLEELNSLVASKAQLLDLTIIPQEDLHPSRIPSKLYSQDFKKKFWKGTLVTGMDYCLIKEE